MTSTGGPKGADYGGIEEPSLCGRPRGAGLTLANRFQGGDPIDRVKFGIMRLNQTIGRAEAVLAQK